MEVARVNPYLNQSLKAIQRIRIAIILVRTWTCRVQSMKAKKVSRSTGSWWEKKAKTLILSNLVRITLKGCDKINFNDLN